jgi:hypothetical protein
VKGVTEFIDSAGTPAELSAFKNRLARSYGAGRISKEDFDDIQADIEKAIEKVKVLKEEPEPVGY